MGTAPQIGRCQSVPEAEEFAAEIDGSDGSWSLPLPEDDGSLLQPLQALDARVLAHLARRVTAERDHITLWPLA